MLCISSVRPSNKNAAQYIRVGTVTKAGWECKEFFQASNNTKEATANFKV